MNHFNIEPAPQLISGVALTGRITAIACSTLKRSAD
ncbi:hypothetical protein FHW72_004075 [Ochrobactrum sp. RC6B]|nr:hypothetical protein [Ochrobactrum sp. RC6B]